jgi:hypothetical protein
VSCFLTRLGGETRREPEKVLDSDTGQGSFSFINNFLFDVNSYNFIIVGRLSIPIVIVKIMMNCSVIINSFFNDWKKYWLSVIQKFPWPPE